jgi:hypothetical protein
VIGIQILRDVVGHQHQLACTQVHAGGALLAARHQAYDSMVSILPRPSHPDLNEFGY